MRALAAAAAALLLVAHAAACGGQTDESDRAFTEAQLAAAASRIYTDLTENIADLPAATAAYVALVREEVDAGRLGQSEAARRLADIASDVAELCGECSTRLDRERALLTS